VGDSEHRKSLLDERDHLVQPIRDLNLFGFGACQQRQPDDTEYNTPTHGASAAGCEKPSASDGTDSDVNTVRSRRLTSKVASTVTIGKQE
jgi:hypothetical protein